MRYQKKLKANTYRPTTIEHVVQKPFWDLEQALGRYSTELCLPYKSLKQLFSLELAAQLLDMDKEQVRSRYRTLELRGRKVFIHPDLITPDIQHKFIKTLESEIQFPIYIPN